MANIKSAIKRIDVAKRNAARNKSVKTEIKNYIKKFESAINSGKVEEARELLKLTDKKLKRAVSKNVFHKNNASRKISKLAKN
ncbi:30S ribosomal protein S20 [Peptoniphilus indolicus ATCC 29427]|uniref:Small ribosomal subunit protein bS20 n=1 Tax=Peptoniphilus indolicus ATCC 29427 TaxID=997350 RepID=G4D4H0_9FIRM|nr:30S ribosomal protein S20 [Peptoniphilus indolicus]EGY79575.1 30S ribosomal protein S20 [Peptoniphilus indolicus ATCC 29427]